MSVFTKLNMLVKIIYIGQDEEINKMHLAIHCLSHFQKNSTEITKRAFKNRENEYNHWKTEKKGSIFQETNEFLVDIGLIVCNGRKPNKAYWRTTLLHAYFFQYP